MGHASVYNEKKFTFIQQHRAVQPLPAIPRMAKPPFGYQTACTDCLCAPEKQPAKVDHLRAACFENDI